MEESPPWLDNVMKDRIPLDLIPSVEERKREKRRRTSVSIKNDSQKSFSRSPRNRSPSQFARNMLSPSYAKRLLTPSNKGAVVPVGDVHIEVISISEHLCHVGHRGNVPVGEGRAQEITSVKQT